MKRKIFFSRGTFSIILILVLTLVLVSSCKRNNVKYQAEPIITDLAVSSVEDFNAMKEKYKGKILVVNFFASWCPPCRTEAPDFLRVYNNYKDEDFMIVIYSIDTDKKAAINFVNRYGLEFPSFLASEELQKYMNVRKVPETFIYGKDGELLEMVPGAVSERFLEVFAKMGVKK